ncbi:MAG: 3-hydroxyacyl-CoA dehydrogenase family protein [Rhodospirillales bacterium]|jgi:3-hydroxybutyryl-CoA dehydrogenase|nr:3-hydroxyacyl-CoA dehydrogenase family protein [Rhodospirillales bacterium]
MILQRIGVVGAGMMGAEIALVFALAGKDVLLSDASAEIRESVLDRLDTVLAKGIKRGAYDQTQRDLALAGLAVTAELADFADRDLVIEAVFEDAGIKGDVFKRLDQICPPSTILASNTSTLPIADLARAVVGERLERFLGTHFFAPVSRMELVEVIPGPTTSKEILESVMEACREAAKTPIRVKDVAGFAVNRALHAFLVEAARLVEEGVVSAEDMDTACKLGLGHPLGPCQLMDLAGNHLVLQVQNILEDAYGERFRARPNLEELVEDGKLGRGTGQGWLNYD